MSKRTINTKSGCFWAGLGGLAAIAVIVLIVIISSLNRSSVPLSPPELTILPRNTDTAVPILMTEQSTDVSQATEVPFEDIVYSQGDLVEVTGTGGEGLRLRNTPSLNGVINILALENEVYEIRGGPTEADGFTWWFLVNPYDNEVQGWSVTNYLQRIGP
jgi:hypothetical protein